MWRFPMVEIPSGSMEELEREVETDCLRGKVCNQME